MSRSFRLSSPWMNHRGHWSGLQSWLIFLLVLAWASLGTAQGQPTEELTNLMPNAELAPGSDGSPTGWRPWTPRPELAPKMAVVTHEGKSALWLQANRFASYGQWVSVVCGVEPGAFYRFEAWSRTSDVIADSVSVMALLTWCRKEDGTDAFQRDYVDERRPEGAWCRNSRTLQVPPEANSVRVELGLHLTEGGSVLWRDMRLTKIPPPASRLVRVVTTRIRPQGQSTIASITKLMADMLDVVGPQNPDVVLFSENLVDRFVALPLDRKVQTIPGPLTDMLAEKAAKYHTYIITTLHERDGDLYYNTAVLIDRAGRIAGTYRKVHLALAEIDWGLTPGSEYPVFDTDFGRIGILTCWDYWFGESVRLMRLRGAEILFLPLAGDGVSARGEAMPAHWESVSKARAMDNGLFFVSAATVLDNQSQIINPAGEVLATATGDFGFAVKDIDLAQQWRFYWLSVENGMGEARSLYIKERRPDTYQSLAEGDAPRGQACPVEPARTMPAPGADPGKNL